MRLAIMYLGIFPSRGIYCYTTYALNARQYRYLSLLSIIPLFIGLGTRLEQFFTQLKVGWLSKGVWIGQTNGSTYTLNISNLNVSKVDIFIVNTSNLNIYKVDISKLDISNLDVDTISLCTNSELLQSVRFKQHFASRIE